MKAHFKGAAKLLIITGVLANCTSADQGEDQTLAQGYNSQASDDYAENYAEGNDYGGSNGNDNYEDNANDPYGEGNGYSGYDTGEVSDAAFEQEAGIEAAPIDDSDGIEPYQELDTIATPEVTAPEDIAQPPPVATPQASQPINLRGMSPPPQPANASTQDLAPTLDVLTWVGFYYKPEDKLVAVKLLATGWPHYEVFQEQNQAEQPELVVRFLGVKLRPKIARDIDASEFRSPIAYIRLREDQAQGSVDVVMTLRDAVHPEIQAGKGKVLLNFAIPEHYFGKPSGDNGLVATAEPLEGFAILPRLSPGSQIPKTTIAMMRDPAGRPFATLSTKPTVPVALTPDNPSVDGEGLPLNNYGTFANTAVTTNPSQQPNAQPSSNGDSPLGNNTGTVKSSDTDSDANSKEGNYQELPAPESQELNPQNDEQEPMDANSNDYYGVAIPDGFRLLRRLMIAPVAQDTYGINNYGEGYNEYVPANQEAGTNPYADPYANDFKDEAILEPVAQGVETKNINAALANEAPIDNGTLIQAEESEATGVTDLEASAEIPEGAYSGHAIEIDFHQAPLSLVLMTFAEESGHNFSFPEPIGAIPITAHYRQVPWDEALKAILETNGLAMAKVGERIVRIDRVEKMTDYMSKIEEASQYKRRLVPVKLLVMRLNHAKASDVEGRVKAILANDTAKDKRIQVAADERTNSIIVEASVEVLAKVKAVVDRIDSQTPLVEISSRIVEVTKNTKNFFGIVWANKINYDPGRGLGFGSLMFPNSLASDFSVDPGVVEQATTGNANFRFGSINSMFDLDLILKMEETKGTTQVRQSNRVLVLDRVEARILSGQSQFFRPAGGGSVINTGSGAAGGATGLSEVQFNLELKVKPEVTQEGLINMDLLVTSDTPGDSTGEALATKNTRQLTTRMARKHGETAVIGGIYDTKKTETQLGVPFFSDLPIIGVLFRSTNVAESITELLIMITPKLANLNTTSVTNQAAPLNTAALGAPAGQASNANYGNQGQAYQGTAGNAADSYQADGNAEDSYETEDQNQQVGEYSDYNY